MSKFFVKSQGCPCNVADSNKITNYLKSQGHIISSTLADADEIIVTTCGFNEKKLQNSLSELRSIRKQFGNKLHIAGCIPKIRSEMTSDFDIVATPKDFSGLKKFSNKINTISVDDFSSVFSHEDMFYIRISTGCTGKCSYCAIKQASGFTTSRSIKDISKDVRHAVSKGYKKIALISEDIGSWGVDIGLKLSDLLSKLVLIEGDFEIMLSSIHPKNLISDKKIIKLLKLPKIGNTIYLPNQSASNKILKSMNREHTIQEYLDLVKEVELARPDIKLQTDLLVGFPGETEEDHQKNIKFIKNTNIYFLQVFMYTPMKRTPSAKLIDLPENIKLKRTKELIKIFLDKNRDEDRLLINTNIAY